MDINCPFCNEDDFDLHGLKWHLNNGHCEPYEALPATGSLFGLVNPRAPLALSDGAKLFNRLLADLGDVPCKYPCLRDDFHDWLDKQPDGSQWLKQREAGNGA